MLNHFSIPRILFLANDHASTHTVRRAIRGAGLTVRLDTVSTREEFFASFRHGSIDLILTGAAGLEGLDLVEIIEQARTEANPIPLVLLSADADAEHPGHGNPGHGNPGQSSQDVPISLVRASQFDRLPSVMERILRERRHQNVNARLKDELDRAAEILRENQKLIVVGRLTASIAHEINNPLEAITNLLYLMETDIHSPEKMTQYLRMAQRELNRVVQISKQTLTFSRETSAPLNTQLSDLIEEVLTLYGRKITDKQLNVIRQYECAEKVTVFPGEMRQVLSNLIANAIEATAPRGKLIFRLRVARNWSDQGVRGIRLSVADSGMGMSPSVRRRLGEPFFTTKGQHGTGLGLWVTRSILHRYGGSLQLRSSVDAQRHGTVFSIFLPTNMRPRMVQSRNEAAPFAAGDAGVAKEISGNAESREIASDSSASAPLRIESKQRA